MLKAGVLALQGDVREHGRAIAGAGGVAVEVQRPEHLEEIDLLVIPGGESTTIGHLASLYGLVEPLREAITAGLPTLGTCAGMIFLASGLTEGSQTQLGVLDVIVQRNAFGRQNESFETELEIAGFDRAFPGVFIRAPWVAKLGNRVEVLASFADHPVMVRQDHVFATSFHPELTDDSRIHRMVLDAVEGGGEPDGEV